MALKRRGILWISLLMAGNLIATGATDNQSRTERGVKPPIMGWSSWNAFRVHISEDIIKNHADLVVRKGLKEAGYRYVNIDDGFFGKRDSNGKMHANVQRFPNDMRPVVEHIHQLGLKAGIYTDAGNHTCGSMCDNDSSGRGAGIYGHEKQDAQLYFKEWGFDFIKIDYCGGGHLNLEEKEQYTRIFHQIQAVRKDVSINICRWAFPGTWAKDVATSWRINTDIWSGWESVKQTIEKNLYLSAYAGNGHYNDMDMMVVGFRDSPGAGGPGLTLSEEEAHFGMWCIMSSPLLIGCKLDKISEASLKILKNKELIALNQDPLGLQAHVVQHKGEGYVLVKDIEKRHGATRAVAFYNPSEQAMTFNISFAELELGGHIKVRDLVKQKDLGKFQDYFTREVAPHSAFILKLEGEQRLEAKRYEAEWAYLPMFDNIGRNKVAYIGDEKASGRMKVSYLGGTPGNYAEWKEVYSEDGGNYDMDITYCWGKDRELEVTVNGKAQLLKPLFNDNEKHIITLPVNLKRGYNNIRLGNSYNWAPDIDCFTLTRRSTSAASYVRPMMGTGADGRVIPIAAMPFGMIQLGPDTYYCNSGYHYSHPRIQGFSHTHKSGGGGTDFQDIVFLPVTGETWKDCQEYPDGLSSAFSHRQETAKPGYYRVQLLDSQIEAELTATERCGSHRYTYPDQPEAYITIDLKRGNTNSNTIIAEDNYDTVKVSRIEWVDNYTVRGYRVSNGWAPEQHVYFYARFSKPIADCRIFGHRKFRQNLRELEGTDIRAILRFDNTDGQPIISHVGISPVSMEGAERNLKKEIGKHSFDELSAAAYKAWDKALSAIQIYDPNSPQKEVFYTSLYFSMLYPQLYSDVTGEYRSSDSKVYKGKSRYFAGVLGLWDTFRAQNPLISILRPDVTNDLMHTFLEHFRHCGQLPIWTLAGVENMSMIGYHAMPVITDAYYKGIRKYDAESLYKAMKESANRDTFGYFLRSFRGARYYKQYEYVPCDLEVTSVSKTLEYCYDDWCIAQMAKMLGHQEDYTHYLNRAGWYKHVFDRSANFMRGKNSDGTWRTPFDPFLSNHYRPNDDFCEGTSWQWSFFVPHDGEGLINLFGGREAFTAKLDSLFISSSEIHGDHPAPDISGMIGQYAHGNEPSHHTIYMYNYAGQPWKGQKLISDVLYTLYNTSPEGICGNDDTGQMSAWFVMSAMGFYPVTHGQGIYFIGSPLFKEVRLRHAKGTLTILAPDVSRRNCYIQSVTFNKKSWTRNWLQHKDLFDGNATLIFNMGGQPNKAWGSASEDVPPSMSH